MIDWGCDECNAEFPEAATNIAGWYRHNRAHERHIKKREAARPQNRTCCRTCGHPANLHLIDIRNNHGDQKTRSRRYCFACCPQAVDDANFVVDRTGEFE
jgi:hypothetical protein